MDCEVKLKIAGTVIRMQSRFPLEQVSAQERKQLVVQRFGNFFYTGRQKPDIRIDIKIVDELPEISGTPVFITYHFEDKSESWRLLKQGNRYIYKCPVDDKRQVMLVNKTFDSVKAYLLPNRNKGKVWNTAHVIYDFLQVLLINYFALRKQGVFTHSIGVKDLDGAGMLFNGQSGAGKSTTARLWHRHSKAMVLNDDRIIVRKVNGKFIMYGSPWHGEFSDYLVSRIESAALKRIFFIHHAPENIAAQVSSKQAFNLLYSALFPTFWDRIFLENTAEFCEELVKTVPSCSLGFVNDKKVIGFVRKIGRESVR
jgi:hypothetical protein